MDVGRRITVLAVVVLAARLLAAPGRADAGVPEPAGYHHSGTPLSTAAVSLSLVKTIDVGGDLGPVVVDHWGDRNDVLVYDQAGAKLRFIDGDTLALAADEVSLPTWNWKAFLVYDRHHHHAYALTTSQRTGWVEGVWHVIADRAEIASISINRAANEGLSDPPDDFYSIEGAAFKQPLSEGANGGLLVVDCARCGAIDALLLDAAGTAGASRARHSYRAPIAGTMYTIEGNTLALEAAHETAPGSGLAASDVLYLYDRMDPEMLQGTKRGLIQAFSLGQGATAVTRLPDVDLNQHWPFDNGMQGLAMAEARDILYASSGTGSFDMGYVAEVNTASNQLQQVIELEYMDQYHTCVDWYDPRRVFIATADDGWNDLSLGLYVRYLYDGRVVDSLHLMDGYGQGDLGGMAFDPYSGRLYATVGSKVFVVQVSDSLDPAVASSAVIPTAGGSLAVPDGSILAQFPAGALASPTQVTIGTVGYWPTAGQRPVRLFELSAVQGSAAITAFAAPFTIAVTYTDSQLGTAAEESLGLYWWDGGAWQPVPSSAVDVAHNRVTAPVDHMSLFAVLGDSSVTGTYLPLLMRSR